MRKKNIIIYIKTKEVRKRKRKRGILIPWKYWTQQIGTKKGHTTIPRKKKGNKYIQKMDNTGLYYLLSTIYTNTTTAETVAV